MLRLFRLSCCAALTLLAMPPLVLAQDDDDPFRSLGSVTDENPFDEEESAARSPAQQPASINELLQRTADRPAGKPCRCVGESDAVAEIQQALRRRITTDGLVFEDTPLDDVVSHIDETYGIPVQLDIPALEEMGIGPDEPVTGNLRGISLRSALRLLLDSHELTYTIQNEVLLVTTPEEAESKLITCVYDVRDLLRRARTGADFDSFIDMIVSCIAVDTWAENGGGEADIRPLEPGFLVISQSLMVHEDICGLLDSIRELKGRPDAAVGDAGLTGSLDEAVIEWNVRQQ